MENIIENITACLLTFQNSYFRYSFWRIETIKELVVDINQNHCNLIDKNGKEYVMRAVKKSATRFLQTVAFKDQYVQNEFENTYAENLLSDFYTTSHPYTPFAVGNLADKIGVSHTNPNFVLYSKTKSIEKFNTDFGDELYLVEERPSDSQKDANKFWKSEAIISTDDVTEKSSKR